MNKFAVGDALAYTGEECLFFNIGDIVRVQKLLPEHIAVRTDQTAKYKNLLFYVRPKDFTLAVNTYNFDD